MSLISERNLEVSALGFLWALYHRMNAKAADNQEMPMGINKKESLNENLPSLAKRPEKGQHSRTEASTFYSSRTPHKETMPPFHLPHIQQRPSGESRLPPSPGYNAVPNSLAEVVSEKDQ